MMIRYIAKGRYATTSGTIEASQFDKLVSCYESRGFTVSRID